MHRKWPMVSCFYSYQAHQEAGPTDTHSVNCLSIQQQLLSVLHTACR